MGHSQEEKARSRERIVAAASRQIRHDGLDGFSVADIMRDAGLTHGGFYGHFDSRDDLVVAGLEKALRESAVAWSEPGKRHSLARVVKGYLSRAHRDNADSGCAVSALGGEIPRADAQTREVMSAHLQKYIDGVARMLDHPGTRDQAIPIVCAMLGALTMSRLITDKNLSNQVLDVTRDFILSSTEPSAVTRRQ